MKNTLTFFTRGLMVCGVCSATALLGGCFGMDIELPPVELEFPVATNATVPAISKDGEKLRFDLPEICDLPDLAEIESDVREALGRAGGLLDIESITLDSMDFNATAGTFDFLDEVAFIFHSDNDSVQLSADLGAQTNITEFTAVPDQGEELDILDMLPGPGECLQGEVVFNGSIPSSTVVYNATMHVTIRSTLHL